MTIIYISHHPKLTKYLHWAVIGKLTDDIGITEHNHAFYKSSTNGLRRPFRLTTGKGSASSFSRCNWTNASQ
ncbi:MAG TPA: hypothetical protein EYH38_02965 [Leucothrix sp.]|nr:hypothetical protein [Leucothrix sp.]